MFDDYTVTELREIRKQLTQKMLANAGLGSFSLPDGVSISVDNGNLKEILALVNDAIRRKTGQGSRFVSVEIEP